MVAVVVEEEPFVVGYNIAVHSLEHMRLDRKVHTCYRMLHMDLEVAFDL